VTPPGWQKKAAHACKTRAADRFRGVKVIDGNRAKAQGTKAKQRTDSAAVPRRRRQSVYKRLRSAGYTPSKVVITPDGSEIIHIAGGEVIDLEQENEVSKPTLANSWDRVLD
jgi:hypothetical protein